MAETHERFETGSTNADAKQLADQGAEHLTVVWAHRQTAGRGRHSREWISEDGNVFWSIILRPGPDWPPVGQLVYVHALALLHAVRAEVGPMARLELKWPNDLLLNGKKVAGTLIEAKTTGSGHTEYLVIGTGINVTNRPEESAVRFPPTSLHEEGFPTVRRDHLVAGLGESLPSEIERWCAEGFEVIRTEYEQHAFGLGGRLRVGIGLSGRDQHEGIYRGIDREGCMLLELADGTTMNLNSGDVLGRVGADEPR